MEQKLKRIGLLFTVVVAVFLLWWINNAINQQVVTEPTREINESATESTTATAGLPELNTQPSSQTREVPAFGDIFDIRERKEAFFSYLLPAIRDENARILQQRNALQRIKNKFQSQPLSAREEAWLLQLADYYGVDTEADDFVLESIFPALELRVDMVPETLVLVQAANESGWGMSRFAQEARNFFGQWCWTEGCGIVPNQRNSGQVYEVRLFPSMEASIRSYMRNLNTHFAYEELRSMRHQLRLESKSVTATPLTEGLLRYSERGDDYVTELQQMIRVNRPIIQEVGENLTPD
ncbi:MAG: Bax protein [Idiomarinaceae bacterium HL-53]|nr:MAG: Bax protein [Idiomarinaceae bacterium HL-53]CUS48978.1 Bax protein [Idiomarinaceae bacterium HL-53]